MGRRKFWFWGNESGSLMSGTTVRMLPRWSVSSYCLLPRAWVAGKDREVLGDVRQLPLLPAHLFLER